MSVTMAGRVVSHYKILEKLGDGGMGSVYRGVDTMLDRPVAIKVVRANLAGEPGLIERFRSEAALLAKLSHPCIATIYSFFRDRDEFFMVMELIDGVPISEWERRWSATTPQQTTNSQQMTKLMMQVLDGLDQAHSMGIVHRDIKPANLLVTREGNVKITDFGIGRVLGSERMTRDLRLVGTIEYLAPERIRGEPGDARADIYAAGVVLYELLTLRSPFERNSDFELMRAHLEEQPAPVRNISANVPLELELAVQRALQKRPEDRFQTSSEMRSALAAIDWQVHADVHSGEAAANATRLVQIPIAQTRLVDSFSEVPVGSVEPDIRHPGTRTKNRNLWIGLGCGLVLLVAVWVMLLRTRGERGISRGDPASQATQGIQPSNEQQQPASASSPTGAPANEPPAPAPDGVAPGGTDSAQSENDAAADARKREAARAKRRAAALKALDQ